MKLKILAVLLSLTLVACASNTLPSYITNLGKKNDIDVSSLYLRGVFNWWEVQAEYQFIPNEEQQYWFVDVQLIADGQPYDFKLSDTIWTPQNTCGGEYKGQPMIINIQTVLVCGDTSENIQFTPNQTGNYRFVVNKLGTNDLGLSIIKI